MNNAGHYNITVRQAEIEGETLFEARVRELPDVCEYADTAMEAYDLAVDTIEVTAEAFAGYGRAMPEPLVPADDFSGRVTLRVPKSLHRALATVAEEEGVSLNQHIVNVLTYFSGFACTHPGWRDNRHGWVTAEKSSTGFQTRRARSNLRLVSTHPINRPALAYG